MTMARQETIFNLSPIIIHAKKAVNGGTSDIMSIAKREPIMVYDLNRNRSPKTNPINPETHSHNQLYAEASVGNIIPLRIQVKIDRKKIDKDHSRPEIIRTVPKTGYIIDQPGSEDLPE